MTWTAKQSLKHQPGVNVQDDQLELFIGHKVQHPMSSKHWIQTIDLLKMINSEWIRVKEFVLDPDNEPKVQMELDELKKGTYKVQSRCNIHGTWESIFEV